MTRLPGILSSVVLGCVAVPASAQVGYNPDFYQQVAPQPRNVVPCGHYGTPACAPPPIDDTAVDDTASADDLFAQGNAIYARRQFAAAMPYFRRAAELGNVRAQSSIGAALLQGTYVPRDVVGGIYWLRKAATAGNRGAQYWMGVVYSDGTSAPLNWNEAVSWYRASADQRYAPAERELGFAYELGHGVPRNRPTAIRWLQRAALDGHDGLPQQYAALLSRPGTPRFASEQQLIAAFAQARDNATISGLAPPPGYHGTLHSCLGNATNQQTGSYGACGSGSR